MQKRIELVQAQREADVLPRTAQTVPSDVASVGKGMLPKDVIEKLKQIENLSKHLRSELKPIGRTSDESLADCEAPYCDVNMKALLIALPLVFSTFTPPVRAQIHAIPPGIRQANQAEEQTQRNIPPPAGQRTPG